MYSEEDREDGVRRVQAQAFSSLVFSGRGAIWRGPTPSWCRCLGVQEWVEVAEGHIHRPASEPEPHSPDGGLQLPRFRVKWAGPSALCGDEDLRGIHKSQVDT